MSFLLSNLLLNVFPLVGWVVVMGLGGTGISSAEFFLWQIFIFSHLITPFIFNTIISRLIKNKKTPRVISLVKFIGYSYFIWMPLVIELSLYVFSSIAEFLEILTWIP